MLGNVRKLIGLLEGRERWQLAGLTVLVVLMGLLQVAGIGSIVPLLGLLTNPNLANESDFARLVTRLFGLDNPRSVLFVLAMVALVAIVISNVFTGITITLMTRFSHAIQARLSITALRHYLDQPYSMFLDRNSAEIGQNVLVETHSAIIGALLPLLTAVAFGTSALFMMGFLVWYDPLVALLAAGVLGGTFSLIFWSVRHVLAQLGKDRLEANTMRFKFVAEALGSIKETKVLGREAAFISQFSAPARRFAHSMAMHQVLSQIPRYVIEALVFGSLLGVVLYLIQTGGALEDIVPVVGTYAFAGYRMLPAMQLMYRGLSDAHSNRVVVETFYRDLRSQGAYGSRQQPKDRNSRLPRNVLALRFPKGRRGHVQQSARTAVPRISDTVSLQQGLELRHVTFTYPNVREPAVRDICLTIPKGAFVGIVGQTGAGKTTLIDIILGLLSPQAGSLVVDGTVLNNDNLRAWQNKIGYVPQDVYLTDDTIAANIALGVPPAERDAAAVERAARIANIHEFVAQQLPKGYETLVGERGVRLSGGQRQRIGIARALYHDPELLVLDEATSDLDQATEAAVHRAIEQVVAAKTVIMIAHRLSITKNCDTLYVLDRGRLAAQGTYQELLAKSADFGAMVLT